MKNFWMIALVAALAVGCGNNNGNNGASNNGSNNGASNNGASNNGGSNNGASNNGASNNGATNNGTSNNGQPNNGVTSGPEEPYVSEFRYYEESDDGFATTRRGYTIGIRGLQISNNEGNQKPLDAADAEAFAAAHLGDATIASMRDGWNCPEVTGEADMGGTPDAGTSTLGDNTWWFEARIQDDGGTQEIKEITGCVAADDAAVMDIIAAMNELGVKYDIDR